MGKTRRVSEQELDTVASLRVAIRQFLVATEDVTRAHGLTPRQYDLLALLHRPSPEGDQTATDIANQLALSRSATTELLTRAAKQGLLERAVDESDMRVKHLVPTKEGTRRFLAAVQDLRGERERVLALLRAATILAAALGSTM